MKQYLFAVLAFFSIGASAGPFGLSKGMSLNQVKKEAPYLNSGPYRFRSGSLAGGHKFFFNYEMVITPPHGLCSVAGIGIEIVDPYGKELQENFRELSSILSAKYGTPTSLIDEVNSNGGGKDPRYWTFYLNRGERVLKASWSQNLPESLSSITLEVRNHGQPYTTNSGYLQLKYEFDNISECTTWLNVKEASGL